MARPAIFSLRPRAPTWSLMFPLGAMRKGEVRDLARRFWLPVADKSDSQDICFVPQGPLYEHRRAPEARRCRGRRHRACRWPHARPPQGDHQLHGRPAPRPRRSGPGSALRRAPRRRQRQVVVGPRESLQAHWIGLRDVNWLGDEPFPTGDIPLPCAYARRRRRSGDAIPVGRRGAKVLLRDGEYGVAAGQACVFYADARRRARVLGGGWIAAP